jgi:hypothetical protein
MGTGSLEVRVNGFCERQSKAVKIFTEGESRMKGVSQFWQLLIGGKEEHHENPVTQPVQ